MTGWKNLVAASLLIALGACATEKDIPERDLDYFELGHVSGWPVPNGSVWRIYRDDQVHYLDYERDGSGKPDRLYTATRPGAFNAAAQAFSANEFERLDTICQKDPTMVQPTDQGRSYLETRIGAERVTVSAECSDGYAHVPEKYQSFRSIAAKIKELVGAE